jgi:amidase
VTVFRLGATIALACVSGIHGQGIAALTPPVFPLQETPDTSNLFPMAPCGGFKLEEATIDEMQTAMQNGALTSVQLVTCYLLRALQVDEYIKSVLKNSRRALSYYHSGTLTARFPQFNLAV